MTPNIKNPELIKAISEKSDNNQFNCPRAKCLTILESYLGTLVYGLNHAPEGEEFCSAVGCIIENNHCVRSLHSEAVAICNAAKRGVTLEAGSAYLSERPCNRCMGLLAEAGITKVYYHNDYHTGAHSSEYCSENLKKHLNLEKV